MLGHADLKWTSKHIQVFNNGVFFNVAMLNISK